MFNNYPYTDFHEMNLDFILKEVTDLKTEVDEKIGDKIKEYIEQEGIRIVAEYDSAAERLTLKMDAGA